jgi:hypothetical protein
MAFTGASFTRVGPQNDNAPTLWMYSTADALTTVDGSGYFNSAANRLKVGDLIYANSSSGPTFGLAVVRSNTRNLTSVPPVAGVVDVSNFTAVGAINSD